MQDRIALYSADGELSDWINEQRLARLQAAGLIARVVRHPKGYVNRAILFGRPEDGSLVEVKRCLGTRYSFREHLDNGHRCWKLRRIDGRDEVGAPVATRGAFLQVVKDCLVVNEQGRSAGAI